MKNNVKDISDDEIRVIGGDEESDKRFRGWKWLLLLLTGIVIGIVVWQLRPASSDPDDSGVFDPAPPIVEPSTIKQPLAKAADIGHGFIEMADTTINDIPMTLYIPHQMRFSLYVGAVDRNDPSILFATQAADVRADNGGIVGAFVYEGETLATGGSKTGFCAIITDTITDKQTVTVGVAENSPFFEEAVKEGGYFFRQFALVDHGQLVENELKGKSVRRAICDRGGEILIVGTLTPESFHDFAQALVDLEVDNAIYLIGANAYGWATDAEGQRHTFGNPDPPKKKWENISYLVMKDKS